MKLAQVVQEYVGLKQAMGSRFHAESVILKAFCRAMEDAALAEVTAEHLHKGSPALIEGRLQQRSWKTEDGQKRHKLEVVARSVKFLGQRPDADDSSGEDVPF